MNIIKRLISNLKPRRTFDALEAILLEADFSKSDFRGADFREIRAGMLCANQLLVSGRNSF